MNIENDFSLKLRYFTPCPGQKVDCCERDLKVDITRALRIKKNSNPDHLGGYEKQELQQTLSNKIFDFSSEGEIKPLPSHQCGGEYNHCLLIRGGG